MGDELQLIRNAKRGSAEAFSELVSGYRERLFRFLLTRCRCYADAEDVLQDTLVSAYRYIDTYDQQWRFSTWLYRIAMRNAARLRPLHVGEPGGEKDNEDDPLAHCIALSERDNLWRIAKKLLSDEVYSALWLRYVEEMSINEISAVLERSGSWTKVNLLRGRRALEAEMNRQAKQAASERYG